MEGWIEMDGYFMKNSSEGGKLIFLKQKQMQYALIKLE